MGPSTPRHLVRMLSAVVVCAASSAFGGPMVQVRDAPGGEYPNGQGGGFYLQHTAAITRVSVDASTVRTEYTGVFDFEIDFLDGAGFTSLRTFCIQPEQGIAFGKNPHDLIGSAYSIRDLSLGNAAVAANADRLRILWANASDSARQDETHASAFQLLLWEFAQDETIDLLDGLFSVDPGHEPTAAALAIATQWLDLLEGGTWVDREEHLVLLHSDTSQNLLFVIPAPPALALLALILLPYSRRRSV